MADPIPVSSTNPVTQAWASFQGAKTHIAAAVGIIAILLVHFGHVTIPGVSISDADWMTNVWKLLGVMAGRSALAKVSSVISPEQIKMMLDAAQVIIRASQPATRDPQDGGKA